MERTPSTWVSASSRTSTTSFSITAGAAPSQSTLTEMVGKSTSGNWLTPMREAATRPKTTVAAMSIQAKTGLRMQASVSDTSAGSGVDAHLHPVPQGLGPAHHHRLTDLQAGADLDVSGRGAQAQGEHALVRHPVLHHVGEEPLLAGAHGRLGDHRRARGLAHGDRHLGERPRPQGPASGIVD